MLASYLDKLSLVLYCFRNMGRGRQGLALWVAVCVALFGGGSQALGAELEFNAALSLTGGCATSKSDPIPDPPISECEAGEHPPKGPFFETRAITVDSFGDIYVFSRINGTELEARIDVFSPAGEFITEVIDPNGVGALAVDSEGYLYVGDSAKAQLVRFNPSVYKPASEEIEYKESPTILIKEGEGALPAHAGVAVDTSDDHLFVDFGLYINEYSSAADGNELLHPEIGKGTLQSSSKISVDAARRKLYASASNPITLKETKVLVLEADPPYSLLKTVDGSNTPAGEFLATAGQLSTAVDEGTGNFFVDDTSEAKKIYEFDENGKYIVTIQHNLEKTYEGEIEVDNSETSPNKGTLFASSNNGNVGHSYAFTPKIAPPPPAITTASFANVTEREAELLATIDPNGLTTEYAFEYTTQGMFEEEGFIGAATIGAGELEGESEATEVSVLLTNLTPGTAYRFRVIANNECEPIGCGDKKEGSFSTFAETIAPPPCPNAEMRIGPSIGLPDCRAYELVTPPDTNGRTPIGVGFVGGRFATLETSPLGDKVSFVTEGGSIPGTEGTGAFNGDPYLATRGEKGWTSANAGPNGEESQVPSVGSVSADQGYSFWQTGAGEDQGSKVIGGAPTTYVRYPDGDSELVGRGSLGSDSRVVGNFISEGGAHIVFQTSNFTGNPAVQLEEAAPSSGTAAIYDRTADEVTHVVSLLPGDVTPAATEDAVYRGASQDGSGIAFTIATKSGKLYFRLDDRETFEIPGPATFAGFSADGSRIFYVREGDLYAFDAKTEEAIRFSENGSVTVANVAANGTSAYVISPNVLTEEANPHGDIAVKGKENMYLSNEGEIHFVGTVTEEDVNGGLKGLGLWTAVVGDGRLSRDPSRTTPNGHVLLFESSADLINFGSSGHAEIYRYGEASNSLVCLSCNPTQASATGDASLQSIQLGQGADPPFSANGYVPNLRSDGSRAFFQTPESLVPGDTDGLQDVYEWESQGAGSCERESGCVYLISSGHSARADYLYAISSSGDDVFFRTADLLLPADRDGTPSIYDARVNGGFAEEEERICEGEGCRPSLTPPPPIPTPESAVQEAEPSKPLKVCPKGKRKVKREGKVHCVRKHHKKSSRHKGKSK